MIKCLITFRTRLIFLTIFAVVIVSSIDSFTFENHSQTHNSYKGTVEGQISAFFPQSSRFRRIYGSYAPVYGAQFTKQFAPDWEFWSGFSWYSRSSRHSRHCCHSTVKIPNLSLGVNYLWNPTSNFDAYLAVGPMFGIVFLNNHSCCGHEKTSAFALGGF